MTTKKPKLKAPSLLTPLYDRVLIQRTEEDALTKGGLYIPEVAREKSDIGVVRAVGWAG